MQIGGGNRQRAAIRHRIARVGRQIGDGGLELSLIDEDRPRLFGQPGFHPHCLLQRARRQPDRVPHEVVDVGVSGLQRLSAPESQQLLGQLRAVRQRLQAGARQLGGGRIVLQQSTEQFQVQDRHAEQVIEVVRDAAGQTPDRLQFLGLAQPFLGAQGLGDVMCHDHGAAIRALLVEQRVGGTIDIDHDAVPAKPLCLQVTNHLAALQSGPHFAGRTGRAGRGDFVAIAPADDLCRAVARHQFG